MKSNIIIMAFMAIAMNVFAQKDPKGWSVVIDNLQPDKVEILPDVWEFYGRVTDAGNTKKSKEFSYAITVNQAIIDQLPVGGTITLQGPQIEPVVQDKCLQDYKLVRAAIEEPKRKAVDEAKEDVEPLAFFVKHKDWVAAHKKLVSVRKELRKEKRNSKKYIKRLKKRLSEREGVNCVYIYNYSTTETEESEGGSDDDLPDD